MGKRINDFILEHKRAEYGKQIIVTLSRQLEERFGRNFEEKNLRRMLQFATWGIIERNFIIYPGGEGEWFGYDKIEIPLSELK